jgi:hypothetical protein
MVMQRIILHVFRRVVEAVVQLLNVILDMPKSQRRPTVEGKETYCRGKRDLLWRPPRKQKRRTRDQERPNVEANETY